MIGLEVRKLGLEELEKAIPAAKKMRGIMPEVEK